MESEFPQGANRRDSVDFFELARELNQDLGAWRFPSQGEHSDVSGNLQRRPDLKLIAHLNKIASQFDIVAGGFGVANGETNRFEIFRRYPSFAPELGDPLFKYWHTDDSRTDLYYSLERYCGKDEFDYNDWMQRVFLLQRNMQTIERSEHEAPRFVVPEFYRGFKPRDPNFLVDSAEIDHDINLWARIWCDLSSADSQRRSGSLSDDAASKRAMGSGQILEDILLNGIRNLGSVVNQADRQQLPESAIFNFIPNTNDDEKSALLHNQIAFLVRNASVSSLLTKKETEDQSSAAAKENVLPVQLLFDELKYLHARAKFPVVPYAIQKLLDTRRMCHFAVPLVKTSEFEFGLFRGAGDTDVAEDGTHDSDLRSSVHAVIFLGTIVARNARTAEDSRSELDNRLLRLQMLLRIAAEPFADEYFYGGIIKARLRVEGSVNTVRTFAHQVKNIGGSLYQNWLVDKDDWVKLKVLLESKCSAEKFEVAKVAPVPMLFQALQQTMQFWSFSSRLEDNFFDVDGLGKSSGTPESLLGVADAAWTLADQSRLLKKFQSASLKNTTNLLDAINYVPRDRPFDCDTSDLKNWRINRLQFDEQEDRNSVVLHGILRVLVLAMENFIDHASLSKQLNLEIEEAKDSLYIICRNDAMDGDKICAPDSWRAELRGVEIIRFVCERFLNIRRGETFWRSPSFSNYQKKTDQEPFYIRIPIGRPAFLINAKGKQEG